jgi:hypothetical protein
MWLLIFLFLVKSFEQMRPVDFFFFSLVFFRQEYSQKQYACNVGHLDQGSSYCSVSITLDHTCTQPLPLKGKRKLGITFSYANNYYSP